MRPDTKKCAATNTVRSFCDCIGKEDTPDPAATAFCKRAADPNGHATGDELVELKKALKDLEDT